MKHAKKYPVLFLILVLLFSLSTPASANSFSDTQGHWAQAAIEALVQAKVISGYPDGTFRPNAQITRAEFSTILVKGLRLQLKTPATPSFADVSPSDWYFPITETAAAAGLVKGYDGRFWPNIPITREQIVTMLIRALNLASQAEAKQNDPMPFQDAASISSWAQGYVILGKKLGLVGGYPDGTFRGGNCATRAEATVMIVKFLQTYGAKVQDPPELTKASYDSESARLRLTFDEEIKVNSTDLTKIGFQFNNGNSVYFLTASSKVVTNDSSSSVLEVRVAGMPDLNAVTDLRVWLKEGAVVDLDGIPNPLYHMAVDFTVSPVTPQNQGNDSNSPLTGMLPSDLGDLGGLIGGVVNTVAQPLGPVLGGVTTPIGNTLDSVAGSTDGLPLIDGVLDASGSVLQPVTGIVSGLTGTTLNTMGELPLVGGVVTNVTEPVTGAVKNVPILGGVVSGLLKP